MLATLTRPKVIPGPLPGQLPSNAVYLRHFHGQQQLQEEWCWAAAAVCIANTYAAMHPHLRTWQQHEIADVMFHRCDCADNPVCDRQERMDRTLRRLGHFGHSDGAVSFDTIRHEIDAGRPLAVRVLLADGGEHFVVVYGYGNNLGLALFDPGLRPGCGYRTTTMGQFAFDIGDWQDTDFTIGTKTG